MDSQSVNRTTDEVTAVSHEQIYKENNLQVCGVFVYQNEILYRFSLFVLTWVNGAGQ